VCSVHTHHVYTDDLYPTSNHMSTASITSTLPYHTAPPSNATVCNGHDVCWGGTCNPGTALSCDDGNVCTDDSCDAVSGCQHTNNNNNSDDATVCNGREVIGGGTCNTGTPLSCVDGNTCTTH